MTARSTSPILASKAGSDLKTHFSVSWNWFWWEPRNLELNGTTKNALQHMIDMFDSTDIQTAYVLAEQMVDRMQKVFNGTNEVCINPFFVRRYCISSTCTGQGYPEPGDNLKETGDNLYEPEYKLHEPMGNSCEPGRIPAQTSHH